MTRFSVTTAICLLSSALLSAQDAGATVVSSLPVVTAGSNSLGITLPAGFLPDGSIWFGSPDASASWLIGDDVITVSGGGNPDPFVNFAVGVIDVGAPSTFHFVFSIPLSPLLVGLVAVDSSLGISLTPTRGTVATITPVVGDIMVNTIGACNAGVDIGSAFTAPKPTGNSPVLSVTHSFSAATTFNTSPGCDGTLTVSIDFKGSGGSTAYGLTGSFEAIPEPAAMAAFGTGLLGLVGVSRRRPRPN